jgi:hypothetical protein
MAYFKSNEQEETRRNPSLPEEPEIHTGNSSWEEYPEEDYDDGFDDPYEDEDELPELSEEEKADIQKKRAKVVFEAGNITGIIIGTVLVLLLVMILFSMVYFVRSDITRNFTLFRIQF